MAAARSSDVFAECRKFQHRTVLSQRFLSLFSATSMNAPFTFLILTLFHLQSLVKETLSGTTLRLEKFSRAARKLEIGTSVIATLWRRWKMLFQSIDPSWLQGLAGDCVGGVLEREFVQSVSLATCFRRANQSSLTLWIKILWSNGGLLLFNVKKWTKAPLQTSCTTLISRFFLWPCSEELLSFQSSHFSRGKPRLKNRTEKVVLRLHDIWVIKFMSF